MMQHKYRQFVLRFYRSLRHPRARKRNRFVHWLAGHLLDKSLWKPTRHTLSGGMAVGLFVNMLCIPGQMLLASILSIFFRVNVPIAAASCWLSNPVTFVPMAWVQIYLGNRIFEFFNAGQPIPLTFSQLRLMVNDADSVFLLIRNMRPWLESLYLGGFVGGLILAPIGYLLTYILCSVVTIIPHPRIPRKNNRQLDPKPTPKQPVSKTISTPAKSVQEIEK